MLAGWPRRLLGHRILAITQDSCAFSDDTGYLEEYGVAMTYGVVSSDRSSRS